MVMLSRSSRARLYNFYPEVAAGLLLLPGDALKAGFRDAKVRVKERCRALFIVRDPSPSLPGTVSTLKDARLLFYCLASIARCITETSGVMVNRATVNIILSILVRTMVLTRTRLFSLIERALELMTCSARSLCIYLEVTAPPPRQFDIYVIVRNASSNTFTVTDNEESTVATGTSTVIVEQMRSLIRTGQQVVEISIQGPPSHEGNDDYGIVPLYHDWETLHRDMVPLARNRRNSNRGNSNSGNFVFEPYP